MIKHCPNCNNRFAAKPSGSKYCCYACYVFDQVKGVDRQWEMIKKYKAHSLPSLKSIGLLRG